MPQPEQNMAFDKDANEWVPAVPLEGTRLYRVEKWLAAHGFRRLARALGRWDERGL